MANSNNNKKYFGFALADSMFEGDCDIRRRSLTAEEVRAMAEAGELTSCLNPSHRATIDAMRTRFDIDVEIPEQPPRVSVGVGDSVVVMGVRGLPRLADRHEYTEEEIASAIFSFSEYTIVQAPAPVAYVVFKAAYWGEGDFPNANTFPHSVHTSLQEACDECGSNPDLFVASVTSNRIEVVKGHSSW